jgi:SAM-dependent methyltransferase
MIDLLEYNRKAWDRKVSEGYKWTVPASKELVERAKNGELQLYLTPEKTVPHEWIARAKNSDVLCLASGGGQQSALLTAFGARVTVLDNSPAQLARDREVAEREGFDIRTIQGDMRDLSVFADASFDLIVNPVSNCFIDDVRVVWRECARVLRKGGEVIAGFANPVIYACDPELKMKGILTINKKIPHADIEVYTQEEFDHYYGPGTPIEWGHSLTDQLGGQMDAGLAMIGFFEDLQRDDEPMSAYLPPYLATRSKKL